MTTLGLVTSQLAHSYTVAVVDGDPKLRTRLARRLAEHARVAAFATLDDAVAKAVTGAPVVLVLGPTFASPDALAGIGTLIRSRPEVSAVLVVDDLSTDVLQHAMRASVRDVVALPADGAQLFDAVARAAEPITVAAGIPNRPSSQGGQARLVTVFSTKGGAGKSVIATNLAVALARNNDRPVAIVDADLQFGDIAVMMKLTPQSTIVNAVETGDRLDVPLLSSFLMRHEPSGVLVLPAPVEPAFADQIDVGDLNRILGLLRSFCSHVIIDTPATFNDIVLGVLEETDDIIVVGGMDIAHIKNVKVGLQTLRLLNIPAGKVRLVLNRSNSKVRLDVADVERTLQLRADCQIPSDVAVPQSINKGVPVVLDSPRSGVARSLERLAAMFPAFQPEAREGGS